MRLSPFFDIFLRYDIILVGGFLMEEVENLLKENDLVISPDNYDNSRVIVLKNSSEFLKWFNENKNNLKGKRIGFYSKEFSKDFEKVKVMNDFLNYYLKVKKQYSMRMDEYNESLTLDSNNRFICEALELFKTSNSGGKFLRATLIALGYQCFKDDDKFLPLGMAFEIFQTSILIHDDIIDKADRRRGVPTIPVRYRNIYSEPKKKKNSFLDKQKQTADSMALCLGDLGFYLSNKIIVQNYKGDDLSRVLDYYTDVVIKTCHGEMIDVILPFFAEFYGDDDNLEDHVMEIYKLKTAWYSVVGPFCLGAILGGLDEEKISVLEDALMNLGIAFQIKDDLLGIYGDEKAIGKSISSDISEFKQTILYAYAINTEYKDELLKIYGKSDLQKEDVLKVQDIFDRCGAKDYANAKMDEMFKTSFERILNINFIDSDKKKLLLGFAEYLRVRNK